MTNSRLVTIWSFRHNELNCKAFLCDQYMCTQDECLWNLQNLTSGSLNPWIIPYDKMNQLWWNECWSLAERPCMVIQWPIQDECLWYFQNWISETLNPWIISRVTKWSSGWPNEHKPLSDWPCLAIQWPIQDEYHWNFQNWISETLNPWIISFVMKWTFRWRNEPIGDETNLLVTKWLCLFAWMALDFFKLDIRNS